jgi:hypothetical protein
MAISIRRRDFIGGSDKGCAITVRSRAQPSSSHRRRLVYPQLESTDRAHQSRKDSPLIETGAKTMIAIMQTSA